MMKNILIILNLVTYNILAQDQLPNYSMLQSILENKAPGQVIEIGQGKLVRSNCSFAFLLGQPTTTDLLQIADILRQMPVLRLVCDPLYHRFLVQQGFNLCPRIELQFPKNYLVKPVSLPAGLKVQKVNCAQVLDQCCWRDRVLDWYGSLEAFLRQGFVFIVLNAENKILAESYGAFIGGGACEIGIASHPDYRKQGYAKIAAEYAVSECQALGLEPKWSCDCANIGSLKTALKVGFDIKQYYVFVTKN